MDQVFLAGEEAVAVSPEGQRATMPLEQFMELVHPPLMDTGLLTLTPGVRAVLSDGRSSVLVYELEPSVRRVQWSAKGTPGPKPGSLYRLAMPYVVILAAYSYDQSPGPFLSLGKHNEVYFRKEPLRDIRTDTLFYPPLLNVSRFATSLPVPPGGRIIVPGTDVLTSGKRTIALVRQAGKPFLARDVQTRPGPNQDQVEIVDGLEPGDLMTVADPRMPLSWLCTQHMSRMEFDFQTDLSARVNGALRELVRHLFDSGFTSSSEQHLGHNNEAGSWFTFSAAAQIDRRVSTAEHWQRATDRDPLFVLGDVPYIEVGMTVEQVARRQMANASGRCLFRENSRAPKTSDDLARLIFNQESTAGATSARARRAKMLEELRRQMTESLKASKQQPPVNKTGSESEEVPF